MKNKLPMRRNDKAAGAFVATSNLNPIRSDEHARDALQARGDTIKYS
jgi:hypothetical protein